MRWDTRNEGRVIDSLVLPRPAKCTTKRREVTIDCMSADTGRSPPRTKPRLEVWGEFGNGWADYPAAAALRLEEHDPLVHRIDVAIRCSEVCNMVLNPLRHQRFNERLVFRLLLRAGVLDVVSGEGV